MSDQEPELTSTKPYLIRAIYEWILDNGLTPHLLVDARYPGTQVPAEFVEDGRIVLNIAPSAVRNLVIGNERTVFGARFAGVARELDLPTEAVIGIFSRENRQGMVFPEPEYAAAEATPPGAPQAKGPSVVRTEGGGDRPTPGGKRPGKGGPKLKVVK
jgi:stringent starvation protein B